MSENKKLKFASFRSQVDPSFWQRVTELKLEVDKLSENVHHIWGYYSNKKPEGQNQIFSVDASSFNKLPDENRLLGIGSIINKNTIESFKDEDKINLLKAEGKSMMEIIKKEAIYKPSLLAKFFVFCFANLKSYHYYYWFAFPAPTFLSCSVLDDYKKIKDVLSGAQINVLCEKYINELDVHNKGFFFIKLENEKIKLLTVKETLLTDRTGDDTLILGFADTSDSFFPSWPLRNFIAFVAFHCPDILKNLKVICLRLELMQGQWSIDNSIYLILKVSLDENAWKKAEIGESWVGWEKNEKGKLGPKLANLKNYMDPVNLAESSVDLNLKLMKWQILPDLNLDIIKTSKCLLVGAGTLGCITARNLMSWGVRHITFIDCGVVSYSNPVRQFLYKFKDTGKSKAEVAASALSEIFPGMETSGLVFFIPMPGHPVGASLMEETKKNVEKLEKLVEEHDAIFLLMDSRESRWLPTLVAAAKEKVVINAALGFDSYLVMRHGIKSKNIENSRTILNSKLLSGDKLGCYFCNDVTAPGNSLSGRTLDQQCTVTRPGVSNMAGALAVELFISILQHPLKGLAPAETDPNSRQCSSLLGIVPHSIRGFISHYQTVLPAVECFSSCVACSQKVVDKYKEEKFDFILKALESKEYLEELSGLTTLQNESLISEILEYSSSDSDE